MPPINKLWQIAAPLPPEVNSNLQGYPAILRQILYNRGFTTHLEARAFLEAQAVAGTEPENLLGMHAAVDRIHYAIQKGETIAIYGDYDADGVTATALLTLFLRALGGLARPYIPNRFDEGYGLNTEALEVLKAEGVQLVITVDCGIRSPEEAAYARSLGLDLIITDHHHPGSELPDAVAVINPKQPGDSYPDKNLAGVGLAYKLAQALARRENSAGITAADADNYLDLVALGTIADMAPLLGENRALVRAGLRAIQVPSRQGLMALSGVARLVPANISAADIGFMLGPRLNAAGRLDSALAALSLLITNDVQEAGYLAQLLENQNRERQQVTRDIQADAERRAFADGLDTLLLFAADPEYNPGVVGLAASRLTDQYYRPAIVACQGPDYTRASCRSIPEFHITQALDECADLLIHHGGHAAAAGFTVRTADLDELIGRLRQLANDKLTGLDLRPTLHADALTTLSEMRPELLNHLKHLEPTGFSNPQAHFVTRDLKVVRSKTVGKDASHLKLAVTDGKITFDAIAFRQGQWANQMPARIDLMYTFEMNEFNGQQTLQLRVRDLKPST
jgi:single-stranded-DNA-specific exonuclease